MWTRTALGILLGTLLALSLGTNLILIFSGSRPSAFLVSYIAGFFVLAGVQTWVFCAPRLHFVLLWIAPAQILSLALNACWLWGLST